MWIFVVLLTIRTMQVSQMYPTWETCDEARAAVEKAGVFGGRPIVTTYECRSLAIGKESAMSPYSGWYDSNAGSGSTDLGEAERPTKIRDVGDNTGKPDSGALEAFGGLAAAVKIERASVGAAPSIDLPGYPMAGEAPGQAHGVHGSMAGDDSKPMKDD